MGNKKLFLLPAFFLLCCIKLQAQPVVDGDGIPEYDYSQTELIVFYGEDGYVLLSNPFEYSAPSMGALLYEVLLLYVPRFQEIIIPPVNPTHMLDLIMRDMSGNRRIGQRLYVGDAWISDGKNIAFMKPEDYRRLAHLLHERYVGAGPDVYDPKGLAGLRRPTAEELPDDWLPGPNSVEKAVGQMKPSDFKYGGYDPGAEIRHRAGKEPLSHRDGYAGEGELPEPGPVKQTLDDAPAVTRQSAAGKAAREPLTADTGDAESPATAPLNRELHPEVPHDAATTTSKAPSTNKRISQPVLLLLLGLTTLFTTWFVAHKLNRRQQ